MCKLAVAGLSVLIGMAWSMADVHNNPVAHPQCYLYNALLPLVFCIFSSYFVAELWGQVPMPSCFFHASIFIIYI